MIYLDTSVLLAELLVEDRHAPRALWDAPLVSSRLLEYEVWTRLHSRQLADSHGEAARQLLGRVALLELASPTLVRALDPFPRQVRTLDALHLASMVFLRERVASLQLATFDSRLGDTATAIGIPLYRLDST